MLAHFQQCVCVCVCVCPVDSITDVFTVNHLKLRAQESPEVFFGLTYSFISRLDLDSSISRVIRTKWHVDIVHITFRSQSHWKYGGFQMYIYKYLNVTEMNYC